MEMVWFFHCSLNFILSECFVSLMAVVRVATTRYLTEARFLTRPDILLKSKIKGIPYDLISSVEVICVKVVPLLLMNLWNIVSRSAVCFHA